MVCALCWEELNNFHKFYLRIENAHLGFNKIKSEPGMVTPDCKSELVTHLPNNECNVTELCKDNVECYFLEPEILIDQCATQNLHEQATDDKSELMPLDDIKLKQPSKHFELYNSESHIDNDPLERAEIVSTKAVRKRKCKKENIVAQNSSNKIQVAIVPTQNLDAPDSEKFDSQIKSAEIEKNRSTKSSGKSRINREECDKFIYEHFKQMNCKICQEPLENFSATQKHFLDIHQQKGYLFCCNRKFFKRRDLVDHIHCHLNPNHFKCAKCGKVLSDRVRLEKHEMGVHGGVKVKKHRCDTCGKSFLEIHDLNRHKLTHLSEDEKKFPCKECGKL